MGQGALATPAAFAFAAQRPPAAVAAAPAASRAAIVRRVEDWRAPSEGAYTDQQGPAGGFRPSHRPWRGAGSSTQPPVQITPPERPTSIRSAVTLMYVGAGMTVLSTVIFFATKGQLADSLAEADLSSRRR